jgi:hypothetical protein
MRVLNIVYVAAFPLFGPCAAASNGKVFDARSKTWGSTASQPRQPAPAAAAAGHGTSAAMRGSSSSSSRQIGGAAGAAGGPAAGGGFGSRASSSGFGLPGSSGGGSSGGGSSGGGSSGGGSSGGGSSGGVKGNGSVMNVEGARAAAEQAELRVRTLAVMFKKVCCC